MPFTKASKADTALSSLGAREWAAGLASEATRRVPEVTKLRISTLVRLLSRPNYEQTDASKDMSVCLVSESGARRACIGISTCCKTSNSPKHGRYSFAAELENVAAASVSGGQTKHGGLRGEVCMTRDGTSTDQHEFKLESVVRSLLMWLRTQAFRAFRTCSEPEGERHTPCQQPLYSGHTLHSSFSTRAGWRTFC